jgi:DNA-directed RNA polymerase specialized sigma24 family protein
VSRYGTLKTSTFRVIDAESNFPTMEKNRSLSENHFNNLLEWLSHNREESGQKYEQIRLGLIRFFRFRGCNDPATLADETINRVALKLDKFRSATAKETSIFHGFAINIYREYQTRAKKEVQLDLDIPLETRAVDDADQKETIHKCLDECLKKLNPCDHEMVLNYYKNEREKRLEDRRLLAEDLGINMGTLHTRVCRLRSVLKTCIKACIAEA